MPVPGKRFKGLGQDAFCRISLIKDIVYYGLMDRFTALAHPTRRGILEMLARSSLSSGEIAARFQVSPPAISQHLQALRGAGLVRVRAEAQRRIYELDRNGVEEVSDWVARLRLFWEPRLDALEGLLKATGQEGSS